MAIAKIIQNKGGGLYQITIDRDRDQIDKELSWLSGAVLQVLTQSKAAIQQKIDNKSQELTKVSDYFNELNNQIKELANL